MVYQRRSRSHGGSPPSSLPSLEPRSKNGSASNPSSASLRGGHHRKVPDINGQQPDCLLPSETHPEPYYVTTNVV